MTDSLTATLQRHFGFTAFRPGQAEAIEFLLSGQHTLVVMPTGAGKSLIYQFAALQWPGLTVVISPLIALMKDQVDSLARHKIPATYINSALSLEEQSCRLQALAEGQYRLAYVAPERLRSILFQEALGRVKVGLLAVDEAHCISLWGHDFRPDYLHIAAAREQMGNPLTVALTATATPQLQRDIPRLLGLPDARRIVTGFNRPNLSFEVRHTAELSVKFQAVRDLLDSAGGGAAIIYTGTRRDAEEVADFTRTVAGIEAAYYHAGLDAETRSKIQEAFISGKLGVVVATNAFGMGIDRPDVRLVAHFNLPGSLEAYYQEAGRAGRDGAPARAVLLYSLRDCALQEYFIDNDAPALQEIRALYQAMRAYGQDDVWTSAEELSRAAGLPEVKLRLGLSQLEMAGALQRLGDARARMLLRIGCWDDSAVEETTKRFQERQRHRRAQLAQMVAYAESDSCRRRMLLDHFGDAGPAEATLCCDNCARQRPQLAPTPPSQPDSALSESEQTALAILDTVHCLRWAVGRGKLAQILKGSQAKDILRFGYNQIGSYGRLSSFSEKEIENLIAQLMALGHLKANGWIRPTLSLTPSGNAAVRARCSIPLRVPREIRREQAQHQQAERVAGGGRASSKDIARFLFQTHPRPLPGPWQIGWTLGFHSSFEGIEWKRSPVGEMVYRLKYQADLSVLEPLVQQILDLCMTHPALVDVDALVPVPPSTPRPCDPVQQVAEAVSARLNLPIAAVLVKIRQTAPQKELRTLAQKRANVAGAIAVRGSVRGKRLLILDDLYDSGATLEEISRVLRQAGASCLCVLTLTRTIHADS